MGSGSLPYGAEKNTGIAASKLVAVYDIAGTQGPYATFGFASGFGALAGMSRNGVTVAEMNLDNALTTFDGPYVHAGTPPRA